MQAADSGYAHKQSKHCKIYSPPPPLAVHCLTRTIHQDLFAQSTSLEIIHLEELCLENIRGKRLWNHFGRQRVSDVMHTLTPILTLMLVRVAKRAVWVEDVTGGSLLPCLVCTYALVEAATSCALRWPFLHRRKWTSSLHPDICEQSEAAPYHTAWFPNILVGKDHMGWAENFFPVCPWVSPLFLITSWKPIACLWCMSRREARFTQLSFFFFPQRLFKLAWIPTFQVRS